MQDSLPLVACLPSCYVAQVFVACTLPDAESCPSQQHLEYVDVIYFVGAHLVADTRGGHTSL